MARKSRKETLYRAKEEKQPVRQALYRAALYGRISVETQEKIDRDTMGTQMTLLKEFAATVPDLVVYDEYIDDDVSGTSFDRPEFERMMRDIDAGAVNCVVVKDLSRFARNHIDAGTYLERIFPEKGVRFIAITDNIDTLKDDGGIIVPFKNIINERYAKESSIKLTQNFKTMQRAGLFCSSKPPYGYRRSEEDKHRFVVDEEAAEVVRKIFEWFTTGVTKHEICKRLEEAGISCPTKYSVEKGYIRSSTDTASKLRWNPEQIAKIVSMRQYCGDMVQNKEVSTFLRTGKKGSHVLNDEEDWIVVEDAHEAIISRELFAKAQKVVEENVLIRKVQREKNSHIINPEYCLSGVLRCAHCGSSINVKRRIKGGKAEYWYICPVHDSFGNARCEKKSMKFEETNEIICAIVRYHMQSFLNAEELSQKMTESEAAGEIIKRLNRQKQQLESTMLRLRDLKSGLYRDLTAGLIENEDYMFMAKKYQTELDECEAKWEDIEKRLRLFFAKKPEPGVETTVQRIRHFMEEETLSKAMVNAFVDSILVDNDGRLEVSMKTKDEFDELTKRIILQEGVMADAV